MASIFRYSIVRSHDKTNEELSSAQHLRSRFAFILLLVVAAVVGYFVGLNQSSEILTPPGHVDHTFYYDKRFSQPPDEQSDQVWKDLFTKGRGFVYKPDFSPDIVVVSVFHQLHCLDAMRRSFYGMQKVTSRDAEDQEETHSEEHGSHFRHCIDYLRQSLMCHADTNLEPVDPVLGGVSGWSVPRKCRNYDELVAWTNEWRTHNQTSIT